MSIPYQTLTASACLLAWTATAVLAGPSKPPLPPAPARKPGYEGYALVQTRNIFDPERLPGIVYTPDASQPVSATATDYAALTGTLITAEKALAFFSGSRPEYNKVISIGGKIAGAKLKQITPTSIEVERANKRITVAVGETVPLTPTAVPGPAPVSTPSYSPPSYPSSSYPARSYPSPFTPSMGTTPSPFATPVPGPIDREALMRRMMEKRQQEIK
ncbi:MAG: hypothetical protein NTZ46_00240 [Verrucomicrobia bacterium]|nr:hypothetical protein [Verrucomicrobiota bacterium]